MDGFLIEFSIFDFSSNFKGPDLQKFLVFELSKSMLIMNQNGSSSSKRLHQHGVCYCERNMNGF